MISWLSFIFKTTIVKFIALAPVAPLLPVMLQVYHQTSLFIISKNIVYVHKNQSVHITLVYIYSKASWWIGCCWGPCCVYGSTIMRSSSTLPISVTHFISINFWDIWKYFRKEKLSFQWELTSLGMERNYLGDI